MKRAVVFVLICVATAAGARAAAAGSSPPPIAIGFISQQAGPSRAVVGASVDVHSETTSGKAATPPDSSQDVSIVHRAKTVSAPSYPTLKSDAPLLQDATPFGPGSFWYGGPGNVACIYQAGSSPLCYTITGPAAAAATPAINPAGIAAAVAGRLTLAPGDLRASPAAHGVTGSDSWFWLDPAPRERALTTSLDGESVTVTATPTVRWEFGDGTGIDGGAGVAYRSGTPPPDAIVHVFQTRCLPGDEGRDPYVLASCGADGYALRATVVWQIAYRASGPVAAAGTLPMRTTETSVAYPVSEVRAFLSAGATQ